MLGSRVLPTPIRVAEADPRAAHGSLFAVEEAALARAVERRRREFVAGRTCARRAMAALGEHDAAIPVGDDRAPVWPDGLVGSITHSDTWCVAAVARRIDGVRAIGIDVEPCEPLDTSLLRLICLPEERAALDPLAPERRGVLGRLLFSAKEAAYKCQYALSRQMLSYHAMRVELDLQAARFLARFQRDATPFARGDTLAGRLVIDHGYMMTAVVLYDGDDPALRT